MYLTRDELLKKISGIVEAANLDPSRLSSDDDTMIDLKAYDHICNLIDEQIEEGQNDPS